MKTKHLGFIIIFMAPILLCSQTKEHGDAPEGVLAYPSTGLTGQFPTCVSIGPSGWVQHSNFGAFFFAFDLEGDGNAGTCPAFAPYDLDECFADNDAGLVIPQPFTINNGQVALCPASSGSSLGPTCQTIAWGSNVDINVQNFMPSSSPGFVNVLIDWDQNGVWGNSVTCPQGAVAEHALVNFLVPNGFSGLLSGLSPPSFTSGPTTGYFWSRFSIMEQPVPVNWTGTGTFEDGESEDYLIYVGGEDFGDAPEGSLAYPASGIFGQFPTCINVGNPNTRIAHFLGNTFFGPSVDGEFEGNAGSCPAFNPNNYDLDECYQDNDAGLLFPGPFTITGAVGNEVVVPCGPTGSALGTVCHSLSWGTDLDISVTGTGYVNVLIDWNQDGQWAYNANTQCQGIVIPEHVLVNFSVNTTSSLPLSSIGPPPFQAGPFAGSVWARFTISDTQVNGNWDGSGTFLNGETEDYLLELTDSVIRINKIPDPDMIPLKVNPNPVEQNSMIEFILLHEGKVKLDIMDMQGNMVETIEEKQLSRGKQILPLSEFNENCVSFRNGVYLIRLFFNDRFAGFAKAVVVQ